MPQFTVTSVRPFCLVTCGIPASCRTLKQSLLLQFLGCWIIFCAANVVKALLAKKMASHFHKQTHFQKMRDAIKKVCLDMYMRCCKTSNWKWTCTGMYKAWILSSNATAACLNTGHGYPVINPVRHWMTVLIHCHENLQIQT